MDSLFSCLYIFVFFENLPGPVGEELSLFLAPEDCLTSPVLVDGGSGDDDDAQDEKIYPPEPALPEYRCEQKSELCDHNDGKDEPAPLLHYEGVDEDGDGKDGYQGEGRKICIHKGFACLDLKTEGNCREPDPL